MFGSYLSVKGPVYQALRLSKRGMFYLYTGINQLTGGGYRETTGWMVVNVTKPPITDFVMVIRFSCTFRPGNTSKVVSITQIIFLLLTSFKATSDVF